VILRILDLVIVRKVVYIEDEIVSDIEK